MNSVKERSFLSGEELYRSVVGESPLDVQIMVEQLLIELGFKNKLIGTQFLKDAILYRYEKHNVAHINYTAEIYSHIAEQQQSSPCGVERAIRHTINDCSQYGNLYAFSDLMHAQVTTPGFVPSNAELISNVVKWLELERAKGHILDDKSTANN